MALGNVCFARTIIKRVFNGLVYFYKCGVLNVKCREFTAEPERTRSNLVVGSLYQEYQGEIEGVKAAVVEGASFEHRDNVQSVTVRDLAQRLLLHQHKLHSLLRGFTPGWVTSWAKASVNPFRCSE